MEVAVTAFAPLLGLLKEVPDHRRAEGKVYQLAYVLLFSILAIVTGSGRFGSADSVMETGLQRSRAGDSA